jgi:hypothetical protein
MANKETLDPGLKKMSSAVCTDEINKVLTDQVTAKSKTDGGLVVLYLTMKATVRALLPVPGSKQPVGNRPADIVKTPRLNKDGEETSTDQSTFKTIFYDSAIGQKLADRLGTLPAKGGDEREVSERDSIKSQVSYGVRLLRDVAMLDYILNQVKMIEGVKFNWIASGKDGKHVVRNRIPIKFYSTEEFENDIKPADKPMKLSDVLKLKPAEWEKQTGDSVLERLLKTGKKAKKPHKKGAANVPAIKTVQAFGDLLVTAANFADDQDAAKKIRATTDEQTLANICALSDVLYDLQQDKKFWQRVEAAGEKLKEASNAEPEGEAEGEEEGEAIAA